MGKNKWSLKELYESFESESFINDYNSLKVEIENFNNWAILNLKSIENPIVKLETFISMENTFSKFTKLLSFASLTLSANAKDDTASKYKESILNLYTDLTTTNFLFNSFVSKLENIEELINQSEVLKNHKFFLEETKKSAKYLLSYEEELLISKLKMTGSKAWENQRDYLTSMLMVNIEIDGEDKEIPLALARNYAFSDEKDIRKKAYFAELKSYEKIDSSLAFSLNNIKGEVINISKIRGYKSPLDMTLIQSRMDKETLDAMISSMKDFLPVFRKYYKKKAEILGYQNGLPFYDLFAPIGEIKLHFSYEEAKNYIIDNFNKFSKNLGDFANHAFLNNWIDLEPREGKSGGAFCSNIYTIGESRILTNFTGSFKDVLTLAHELGHGYHGLCLKNETYLNSSYTMPIAETASTMCETIVSKAAIKNASEKEKLFILENDISGMSQIIVDIYCRFLFEDDLFKRRESSSLSVKELNEMMIKAQKESYGEVLDFNYLHPYMWACKTHYYYASRNYYNFPYAYGLLFSKGLYSLFLEKGTEFVELYDNLLSNTGKNNLRDIAKIANIETRNKDFWIKSLREIEKDINMFLEI